VNNRSVNLFVRWRNSLDPSFTKYSHACSISSNCAFLTAVRLLAGSLRYYLKLIGKNYFTKSKVPLVLGTMMTFRISSSFMWDRPFFSCEDSAKWKFPYMFVHCNLLGFFKQCTHHICKIKRYASYRAVFTSIRYICNLDWIDDTADLICNSPHNPILGVSPMLISPRGHKLGPIRYAIDGSNVYNA
jgi:hypothetical protein